MGNNGSNYSFWENTESILDDALSYSKIPSNLADQIKICNSTYTVRFGVQLGKKIHNFIGWRSVHSDHIMPAKGGIRYSIDANQEEVESMAKDLGVKPSEVREMEKRLSGIDMSFDPLSESDDEEASYAPSQYLEDVDADPAEIFEKDSLNESNATQLYEAINQLDDRSRDIIQDTREIWGIITNKEPEDNSATA